jgi:tripartite-type tricarboxylate transporter receptor subunit TctC
VTTAHRVTGLESVPAIADTLPGFDYAGWLAVVAPVGTPAAAIQRFNRDLDAVLAERELATKILAIGPVTEGAGSTEQMASFLRQEHERWGNVTKVVGILPE